MSSHDGELYRCANSIQGPIGTVSFTRRCLEKARIGYVQRWGGLLGAFGKQVEQQLISLYAAVNRNCLLCNDWAGVHLLDCVKKTHANLRSSFL